RPPSARTTCPFITSITGITRHRPPDCCGAIGEKLGSGLDVSLTAVILLPSGSSTTRGRVRLVRGPKLVGPRNRVGGLSLVVWRMCLVMQKQCVIAAESSKEALWLS